MSHASASLAAPSMSLSSRIRMLVVILMVVLISEAIGSMTFAVGPGKIVLQPMLWAIFIGAVVAALGQRLPAGAGVDTAMQTRISGYLQYALLPFLAKLGLMVGGALPQVREAGWALVFQEFGHFFGTMAVGLPLALLLGIKREAIGATFSVGREPSLAIIGERYGMNSPEGRGVMAEYITGTVIGALFVALLAGFITSLNIFDPRSLAMGAGVGSGSMMAAGVGAIASQQTPEMAHQVAALAAAANLLTTVVGVYFTLFISLPTTIWLYGKLEPVLGRFARQGRRGRRRRCRGRRDARPRLQAGLRRSPHRLCGLRPVRAGGQPVRLQGADPGRAAGHAHHPGAGGADRPAAARDPQAAGRVRAVGAGHDRRLPRRAAVLRADHRAGGQGQLPALHHGDPGDGRPVHPQDLPAFRKLGWKIVVVSLAANAGTFLGATMIAEFFH